MRPRKKGAIPVPPRQVFPETEAEPEPVLVPDPGLLKYEPRSGVEYHQFETKGTLDSCGAGPIYTRLGGVFNRCGHPAAHPCHQPVQGWVSLDEGPVQATANIDMRPKPPLVGPLDAAPVKPSMTIETMSCVNTTCRIMTFKGGNIPPFTNCPVCNTPGTIQPS